MPDCVNAAMDAVKASGPEPPGQALAMKPHVLELPPGDNAVLARRDPRDQRVRGGGGDFLTHARE
jgi:hypothetical protein